MLKIAMLSYWHVHAWDYTQQALEHEECQIVAVWDEIMDRGKEAAEKLNVPFYENLEDLLKQKDIDAVIVDTPTHMHEEIIIAAANAGKHIFTEKVLVITTAGADRIIHAVQENNVQFMISLPRLVEARTQYIKKVLDDGLLGQITLVRTRLAHDGALPREDQPNGWLPEHFYDAYECGGGALIDLGCHPMYLAYYFLGMPVSITAQFGYVTDREVEDNAVATLKYDSGAIAVVEASFVSRFSPFSIEIYGTEGCLLAGKTIQMKSNTLSLGENNGWIIPDQLPASLPSALNQWVNAILYEETPSITIEQGRALTILMEASNRSASEGVIISL